MFKNLAACSLLLAAFSLAACGGGGSSYSAPATVNPGGGGTTASSIVVALPSGTIGVENDPTFGQVAGFTQSVYSQVLAFAPGTQVTIRNSSSTAHTFNVLSTTGFPANPTLSTNASGNPSSLDSSYASGNINPGFTIGPITLTAGTYYIGCAYHYLVAPSMRTALLVSAAATPGPQATPGPTTAPGGTGGCSGIYC